MVMFLLSFVKGSKSAEGWGSKSTSGYGPGGSISASGFGPGAPILGGSKSARTPATRDSQTPAPTRSQRHHVVARLLDRLLLSSAGLLPVPSRGTDSSSISTCSYTRIAVLHLRTYGFGTIAGSAAKQPVLLYPSTGAQTASGGAPYTYSYECLQNLRIIQSVAHCLGIPLAEEKVEGPSSPSSV